MGFRGRAPGRRSVSGLPLVEILVVVFILGVLAVVAVPNFLAQERRAVDVSAKFDLRTIATQMESLQQEGKQVRVDFEAPRLSLGKESITLSDGSNPRIFGNDADGLCIQVTNRDGSDPVRGYVWRTDAGGMQPAGVTCAGYDQVLL
jgi:type IV pilus assembly protein PilA